MVGEIRTVGREQFAALGRRLRQASRGQEIRKALSKAIQEAGKPVVRDVQAEVRGLSVRGVAGGGSRAREAHWAARWSRGRDSSKYASSHTSRRRGGHGLRASAARTVKVQTRYAGKQVGIRIWSNPASMPPGQRNLPAYLNDPGGWRHPVFGNRRAWVKQVGGQWFEPPIERDRDQFLTAIERAVDAALRQL